MYWIFFPNFIKLFIPFLRNFWIGGILRLFFTLNQNIGKKIRTQESTETFSENNGRRKEIDNYKCHKKINGSHQNSTEKKYMSSNSLKLILRIKWLISSIRIIRIISTIWIIRIIFSIRSSIINFRISFVGHFI